MWLAKDKNGTLDLYKVKPVRTYTTWCSNGLSLPLDKSLYPHLKWEDEPMKVDLIQQFDTREHNMLELLNKVYAIADEGSNWIDNDASGALFCNEICDAVKPIIERIKKEIELYIINPYYNGINK